MKPDRFDTCPPCTGECMQGRRCPADGPPHDPSAVRLVLVVVLAFWLGVLWLVKGCVS